MFLHIHIVICISNVEIVCVLLDFTQKKTNKSQLAYRRFLEHVANARGSWFLIRGAPLMVERSHQQRYKLVERHSWKSGAQDAKF